MTEDRGPIGPGPDDRDAGGAGDQANEPPPGSPDHGPPQQGFPQQPGQPGYPQQGHPQQPGQQGHPQQGHPQQGHPQQGQPGYGHGGYPQHPGQQGYPQQGNPQYGYGQPAYGQPGYANYGAAVPSGAPGQNANVALGLSIGGLASYLIGFCCAPLALIGLVLCGVGLFMGYRETQAIENGAADPAGRGAAKAAQVVGGIGVGLFVLGIALFGALFGASAFL